MYHLSIYLSGGKINVVKGYVWKNWVKKRHFYHIHKFSVSCRECQNKRLKTNVPKNKILMELCSCASSQTSLLFSCMLVLGSFSDSFSQPPYSLQSFVPFLRRQYVAVNHSLGLLAGLWMGCPRSALIVGSIPLLAITAEAVAALSAYQEPRAGRQEEWLTFSVQIGNLQKCKKRGARFPTFTVQPVDVSNQKVVCFRPEQQTTCLTSHSRVNIKLQHSSVCEGSSQFYYFNNKVASKDILYIDILPL